MNAKKKVLVTGSNGMLGKQIVSALCTIGYEVHGLDRQVNTDPNVTTHLQYDLLNKTGWETLALFAYECIIHCAANVNVDECETDPSMAYALHQEATKRLISYSSPDGYFIYISTDSVFDGTQAPYGENDPTHPVNVYALSKLAGEKEALSHPRGLVIRTNLYGLHDFFSNSLVEWAISALSTNQKIVGFDDIVFNPLYTRQVAEIVVNLVSTPMYGVLHLGSKRPISKYFFLTRLAKAFDLPASLIQKGQSTTIPMKAKRPQNTALDITKAESILGPMPALEKGLKMLRCDFKLARDDINA